MQGWSYWHEDYRFLEFIASFLSLGMGVRTGVWMSVMQVYITVSRLRSPDLYDVGKQEICVDRFSSLVLLSVDAYTLRCLLLLRDQSTVEM